MTRFFVIAARTTSVQHLYNISPEKPLKTTQKQHLHHLTLCYIGLPHSHEKKEFHWHIYYIKRKKEPDIASFLFISTKYRVLFFLRLRGLEPRTP